MCQFSESLKGDLVEYTRSLLKKELKTLQKSSEENLDFDLTNLSIISSYINSSGIWTPNESGCDIRENNSMDSVGILRGCWKGKRNTLKKYVVISFINDLTFELMYQGDPEMDGHVDIFLNGTKIGKIQTIESRSYLFVRGAWKWKLVLGEDTFGTVERKIIISPSSLEIKRPENDDLSLLLAYNYPFSIRTFLPVRLFAFFFGYPLPNLDDIAEINFIFDGELSLDHLSTVEKWYYLIITLHFREMLLGFSS